jgi:hypothetical protein
VFGRFVPVQFIPRRRRRKGYLTWLLNLASQALAHHLHNTCGGLSGGANISLWGRIV